MIKAAFSWSAGKDSCLAWLLACERGFAVETFVTMCKPDGLSKSHALPPALIEAQERAVRSAPPLSPTEFVLPTLTLAGAR